MTGFFSDRDHGGFPAAVMPTPSPYFPWNMEKGIGERRGGANEDMDDTDGSGIWRAGYCREADFPVCEGISVVVFRLHFRIFNIIIDALAGLPVRTRKRD